MLQLVQAPWQRMAVSLGRNLSVAATPGSSKEGGIPAMEQQHLQEEQAVPLPPQRLSRSERARERDDAVLSFAERIFAAKLDASDSEDEQADVVSTATAPAPLEVAAPEDAFAAAAAREYKKADHLRRKRAKKLAASELGSYQARGRRHAGWGARAWRWAAALPRENV